MTDFAHVYDDERGADAHEPVSPTGTVADLLERATALTGSCTTSVEGFIAEAIDAEVGLIGEAQVQKTLAKALGINLGPLQKIWMEIAKRRVVSCGPTIEEEEEQRRAQEAEDLRREGDEAWAKCEGLAKDPGLFGRLFHTAERLGIVAERQAILGVYLTLTSRLLRRRALSMLRKGSAASGKSVLVDAVLQLFTRDADYITASGGSPKSLCYYGGEDVGALRHKAIYIPEAASIADKRGAENDFTTMLRVLISEGRIEYPTVVTREGDTPITVVMRKDGPIATVITSARDNIEPELLTRLLVSEADEGDAQTQAVLARIGAQAAGKASEVTDDEIGEWRALQTWLRATGPHSVVIPYAESITALIPPGHSLRIRRDVSNIMAAISASALVHAAQRTKDKERRIVATLSDYKIACAAFTRDMAALHGVRHSENVTRVVDVVKDMIASEKKARPAGTAPGAGEYTEDAIRISARKLRAQLGIASQNTAYNRLNQAVDAGLLEEMPRPGGGAYGSREARFYTVVEGRSATATTVFPYPAQVEEHWSKISKPERVQDSEDSRTG